MNSKDFEVFPRSRMTIRSLARSLRRTIGVPNGYFPVTDFLEFMLPIIDPSFELEIWPIEDMNGDMGRTIPSKHRIILREDIYDQAIENEPISRLTIAHEIGHYFLHQHEDLSLARTFAKTETPAYRCSEWQANCFAGELLVPFDDKDFILASSIPEISDLYGVSVTAAALQKKHCL